MVFDGSPLGFIGYPPVAQCQRYGFCTRVGGRFVENGIDVELHSPFADTKPVGDFLVCQAPGGKSQHFVFAGREGMFRVRLWLERIRKADRFILSLLRQPGERRDRCTRSVVVPRQRALIGLSLFHE